MERQTVFIGLVLVGLLLFGCVQSPSGTTTTTQKTTSTITPTSTSISPTSTTLSQSSDNQWKYQFYDSAKFFSGIPLGWNEVSIQNPMVTGVNLINNATKGVIAINHFITTPTIALFEKVKPLSEDDIKNLTSLHKDVVYKAFLPQGNPSDSLSDKESQIRIGEFDVLKLEGTRNGTKGLIKFESYLFYVGSYSPNSLYNASTNQPMKIIIGPEMFNIAFAALDNKDYASNKKDFEGVLQSFIPVSTNPFYGFSLFKKGALNSLTGETATLAADSSLIRWNGAPDEDKFNQSEAVYIVLKEDGSHKAGEAFVAGLTGGSMKPLGRLGAGYTLRALGNELQPTYSSDGKEIKEMKLIEGPNAYFSIEFADTSFSSASYYLNGVKGSLPSYSQKGISAQQVTSESIVMSIRMLVPMVNYGGFQPAS